jgi:hypothetical protein
MPTDFTVLPKVESSDKAQGPLGKVACNPGDSESTNKATRVVRAIIKQQADDQ